MARTGKTLTTLLAGIALGTLLGYLMATDKDKRAEDMEKLKARINDMKTKMKKQTEDLEHDIYQS